MSQSEFIYMGENACALFDSPICLYLYIFLPKQRPACRHVLIIILLVQLANLSMNLVQDVKINFLQSVRNKKQISLAGSITLSHTTTPYMRKSITIIYIFFMMFSVQETWPAYFKICSYDVD
jgi:hypothetical protein